MGRLRMMHHQGERGQAMLELALVMPLLLVLVLAAFDIVVLASTRARVENAAAEIASESALCVAKEGASPAQQKENFESQVDELATGPDGVITGIDGSWGADYDYSRDVSVDNNVEGYFDYHTFAGIVRAPIRHATIKVTVSADLKLATPIGSIINLVGGQKWDAPTHIVSKAYSSVADATTSADWPS